MANKRRGLKNVGNSCFLNSVLQALASCSSLEEFLINSPSELAEKLLYFIEELKSVTASSFLDAEELLQSLPQLLATGEQQDAQELFQAIMDKIDADDKTKFAPSLRQASLNSFQNSPFLSRHTRTNLSTNSEIGKVGLFSQHLPFKGFLVEEKMCKICHLRSIRHVEFIQIPLNLPPPNLPIKKHQPKQPQSSKASKISLPKASNSSPSGFTLNSCIEAFQRPEVVEDVECDECSVCSTIKVLNENIKTYSKSDSFLDNRNEVVAMKIILEANCARGGSDRITHLSPILDSEEDEIECLVADNDSDLDVGEINLAASPTLRTNVSNLTKANVFQHNSNSNSSSSSNIPRPLKSVSSMRSVSSTALRHMIRKVKTSHQKQSYFSQLPSILCFHINRREYDFTTFNMIKRLEHVSFPLSLDMSPFVRPANSESVAEILKKTSKTAINYLPSDMLYDLCAVVNHKGNESSGHYICYAKVSGRGKEGSEGSWVLCSDHLVMEVELEAVLKSEAFMLFYSRKVIK